MKKICSALIGLLGVFMLAGLTSCGGLDTNNSGSVTFTFDSATLAQMMNGTERLALVAGNASTEKARAETTYDDSIKYGTYFFPSDDPAFAGKTIFEWYIADSDDDSTNHIDVTSLFLFTDGTFLTTVYKADIDSSNIYNPFTNVEKRCEWTGSYAFSNGKTETYGGMSVTNGDFALSITKKWNKTANTWEEASDSVNVAYSEVSDGTNVSKAIHSETAGIAFVKINGTPGGSSDTPDYPSYPQEQMSITIALFGTYNAQKTVSVAGLTTTSVSFDDIPVDSEVQAVAFVTSLSTYEGKTESDFGFYGYSEQKRIEAGDNDLSIVLGTIWSKKLVSGDSPFEGKDARGNMYQLYVAEPESGTKGEWAIMHQDQIVSFGTYNVLSWDDNKNPASLSMTEYAYADEAGAYHVVPSLNEKTYAVTDGKLTVTGTNGVQLVFTISGGSNKPTDPAVDVEAIVEQIEGLTADATIAPEGTLDDSGLTSIGTALKTLSAKETDVKVSLDLSKVTGLTEISGSAFKNCSALAAFNFPASVTSIGNLAFYGCSALTALELPATVTSIGSDAFKDCSKLATVNYGGTSAQKASITIDDGNYYLLNATWNCNDSSTTISGDGITITLDTVSTTDEGGNVTLTWAEVADGLAFTATPKEGTYATSYKWTIEGITPEGGNEGGSVYTIPTSKYKELSAGIHYVVCAVTIGGEPYSVQIKFTVTVE